MLLDVVLLAVFGFFVLRYTLRIRDAIQEDLAEQRRRQMGTHTETTIEWEGEPRPRAAHQEAPWEWPRPDDVVDVRWRDKQEA
jgi:hypothetical protein